MRVVWLVCDLLGALFMYLLARRMNPGPEGSRYGALATLTFLFMPRTLFVIEQSFTEPLIVASLGAFAFALSGRRKSGVLGLLLGLWLSSKQYVVVVIPLLARLRRCRLRVWVIAAAVVVTLFVPFVIWDLDALYYDLVGFFLGSPGRVDSLSLCGVAARLKYEIPWWLVVSVWAAGVGFFTWKMRRTLAGWLFATASCWMLFFMLGKQAVVNYFYLIAFALLLAVSASPYRAPASDETGETDNASTEEAKGGSR